MASDIFVMVEHLRGEVADISQVMLAAARSLADSLESQVVAMMLCSEAGSLVENLNADQVYLVEDTALAEFTSDAYQQVAGHYLKEFGPRLMLFGDTSIGSEVAGPLSAKLGLPLVSSCRKLWVEGGDIKFASQICGGKIVAEGELSGPTALVTMIPGGYQAQPGEANRPPQISRLAMPALERIRVRLSEYIEPDVGDIDITKEAILISVGRGIQNQDNIELVEDLAEALGGVVSASRPVVDQGWLPASRLVGKSGKRVRPKLYLAIGISGAPEHVEAVTDSEQIVAINTDPAAPIFTLADYGVVTDLFDILPELIQKTTSARAVHT